MEVEGEHRDEDMRHGEEQGDAKDGIEGRGGEEEKDEDEDEDEDEDGELEDEFTVLNEFQLPGAVHDLLWCPTMDLLLLQTKKGDVSVYRISPGQRIASIRKSDESERDRIATLCWKHDGRQIAVAHSNGQIHLHDVVKNEDSSRGVDKNEVALSRAHKQPLCSLQWVPAAGSCGKRNGADDSTIENSNTKSIINSSSSSSSSSSMDESITSYDKSMLQSTFTSAKLKLEDRTPEIFRSLPVCKDMPSSSSVSAHETMMSHNKGNNAEVELRPHRGQLNYLVSGDEGRIVQVRGFGLLTLLTIDLNLVPEMREAQIDACGLSGDSRRLTVLASSTQGTTKAKSVQPHILIFDTKIISELDEELRLIAQHTVEINYLLSYVDSCLEVVKSRWCTAYNALSRKLGQVAMAAEEKGTVAAPLNIELMHLLVTGIPSVALRLFLSDYLQKNRLQDMKRGIDLACATVLRVCEECIHPALEQMLFRLGELQGVVEWTKTYRGVDLKAENNVKEATKLGGEVLMTLEGLKHATMGAQKGYKRLFAWLASSMQRLARENEEAKEEQLYLGEDNFEEIAACLNHDIIKNRLGRYFKDSPMEKEDEDGRKPEEGMADEGKGAAGGRTSLAQAMKKLRKAWGDVILQPDEALSRSVSLMTKIKIDKDAVKARSSGGAGGASLEPASNSSTTKLMAIDTTHTDKTEYAAFVRETKSGNVVLTLLKCEHRTDDKGSSVSIAALEYEQRKEEDGEEEEEGKADARANVAKAEIISVAFYDGTYVGLLLRTAKNESRLWLVDYKDLEYKDVSERKNTRKRSDKAEVGASYVIPFMRGVRSIPGEVSREGLFKCAATGFTLCAGRQSAAIMDAKRKIIALDVSERDDEDGDEDEDEDENEGEEGEDIPAEEEAEAPASDDEENNDNGGQN